jgi:hypothetical protein
MKILSLFDGKSTALAALAGGRGAKTGLYKDGIKIDTLVFRRHKVFQLRVDRKSICLY